MDFISYLFCTDSDIAPDMEAPRAGGGFTPIM